MQNPPFFCIIGSANRQLLTGTDSGGTAGGEGWVGWEGDAVGVERVGNGRNALTYSGVWGSGSVMSSPGGVRPVQSPGWKRISVLSKRHRMHLSVLTKLTFCQKAFSAADRRGSRRHGWGRGLDREGVTPKESTSQTPKASRRWGMGGFPLPADYRVWGSVVSFPAGSGAKPRPKTDFSAFQTSQNASRWHVCRKLMFCPKTF